MMMRERAEALYTGGQPRAAKSAFIGSAQMCS